VILAAAELDGAGALRRAGGGNLHGGELGRVSSCTRWHEEEEIEGREKNSPTTQGGEEWDGAGAQRRQKMKKKGGGGTLIAEGDRGRPRREQWPGARSTRRWRTALQRGPMRHSHGGAGAPVEGKFYLNFKLIRL
jgi:hypothetical protein